MAGTVNQPTLKPTRKVAAGAIGGAGGGIVVAWAWGGIFPDYPMPPEVAAAIGPMIGAAIAYFTRERRKR